MKSSGEQIVDSLRLMLMWSTAAIHAVFGNTDSIFLTLIIFMIVDYVTGICVAIVQKKLSSKIGFQGLLKKFGMLCIISLATLIERFIVDTTALRNVVILFYISNEGISILENIAKLGVPIPSKIKEILNTLVDKDSEKK